MLQLDCANKLFDARKCNLYFLHLLAFFFRKSIPNKNSYLLANVNNGGCAGINIVLMNIGFISLLIQFQTKSIKCIICIHENVYVKGFIYEAVYKSHLFNHLHLCFVRSSLKIRN